MTVQLSADDRRAVDLVLEHIAGVSRPTRSAVGDLNQRVVRVFRLLDLLDTWCVEDVPEDLGSRTLRKIAGKPAGNTSAGLDRPGDALHPRPSA